MRWKKDNLQIFTFKKNVLRQLLFLEIVSSQRYCWKDIMLEIYKAGKI